MLAAGASEPGCTASGPVSIQGVASHSEPGSGGESCCKPPAALAAGASVTINTNTRMGIRCLIGVPPMNSNGDYGVRVRLSLSATNRRSDRHRRD